MLPRFSNIFTSLTASVLIASVLITLNATPAEAKEYNKSKGVPSDSQALVNRIQAEMSSVNGEGAYGSMESDCDELNVGANSEETRPDEQVIIADKIVNVAGHCRMVRSQGGFKPKTEQPDSLDGRILGKPPAKKP